MIFPYFRYISHKELAAFRRKKQQERRDRRASWEREWITLSELKSRQGWTGAAIQHFLGDPVPAAESGSLVNRFAYQRHRVEQIEKTAKFKTWHEEKRSSIKGDE
ncbi:hypothetical protein [Xenorhabdus hominickii]|uniref:Uncharacterized protein n=1 Tax=Xenorhabdus hominickii TaxID=351679 RepID=A0A1V0M4K3_XENHO|nr:hypothetical protein [Xenorhabdus hominickii]ARD69798.1 hypothetical protein [Xenorhabdus hominickii]PHM51926.1 hypothetical protein Xhom_04765 [Xenorhabdus hominickii]